MTLRSFLSVIVAVGAVGLTACAPIQSAPGWRPVDARLNAPDCTTNFLVRNGHTVPLVGFELRQVAPTDPAAVLIGDLNRRIAREARTRPIELPLTQWSGNLVAGEIPVGGMQQVTPSTRGGHFMRARWADGRSYAVENPLDPCDLVTLELRPGGETIGWIAPIAGAIGRQNAERDRAERERSERAEAERARLDRQRREDEAQAQRETAHYQRARAGLTGPEPFPGALATPINFPAEVRARVPTHQIRWVRGSERTRDGRTYFFLHGFVPARPGQNTVYLSLTNFAPGNSFGSELLVAELECGTNYRMRGITAQRASEPGLRGSVSPMPFDTTSWFEPDGRGEAPLPQSASNEELARRAARVINNLIVWGPILDGACR
jgi:hypothetical protein